jgi:hypothetical protein
LQMLLFKQEYKLTPKSKTLWNKRKKFQRMPTTRPGKNISKKVSSTTSTPRKINTERSATASVSLPERNSPR